MWMEGLTFLGLVIVIVLMFAVWLELRRLREILGDFFSSSRENSRSLMAAIHEVGALSIRARRPDLDTNKVSGEVD
jgi:hypothetical protein